MACAGIYPMIRRALVPSRSKHDRLRRGVGRFPRGALSLELRSVNSRFLDLQFRIADELRALEPLLRERIAARLTRGKVDCRLSFAEGTAQVPPQLDAEALARLRTLAAAAAKAFPDAAPLRVADVLRWPGVLADAPADEEGLRSVVAELSPARARRAGRDARARRRQARRRDRASACSAMRQRVADGRARWCRRRWRPTRRRSPSASPKRSARPTTSASAPRSRCFAAKADVDEELDRLRAHLDEVQTSSGDRRRGRQAPGLPRAGAEPRGQHARLQGGERGDLGLRARAEGADRADPRAGAEPRIGRRQPLRDHGALRSRQDLAHRGADERRPEPQAVDLLHHARAARPARRTASTTTSSTTPRSSP